VPVGSNAPSKLRPVTQTAHYAARMPAPSASLTREQRDKLDIAFSSGRVADGVSFDPATGVQSFGVVNK
jgi:hypothetical protein